MGLLTDVKKLRDEAHDFLKARLDSNYELSFDDKYNLYIKFNDEYSAHLPVIKLRPYQQLELMNLFSKKYLRFAVQWPRRSGKEIVSWQIVVIAAIIEEGMYIMGYPNNVRAKKILWQGAALVNGVSVKFLNMIPRRLIAKKNDAEMTIELTNGSIIWVVGSDIDPEKLRGTNPRGMVLSEFAFSDPRILYNMLPVFRQNGGWIFIQSTFDGQNHFYRLLKDNLNNPLWRCVSESVISLVDENGERYITDEQIDEDRKAGMPEYLIQQEYYGNVIVNEETKYFAIAVNQIIQDERIISDLIIPRSKVYAFYDIGVNDCTAITLAQFNNVNGKLWANAIGYIENNNRDLNFYVNEIRQFCNRYNLPFGEHFVPHDGKNRNWNDGLKNTLDYLQEMGEKGQFVARPPAHRTAIEAIRRQLYFTKFNAQNCVRLVDCISSYEKEYDEKMGKYKDMPNHDWSSHGVKSFQTMALAIAANLINDGFYEIHYYAS